MLAFRMVHRLLLVLSFVLVLGTVVPAGADPSLDPIPDWWRICQNPKTYFEWSQGWTSPEWGVINDDPNFYDPVYPYEFLYDPNPSNAPYPYLVIELDNVTRYSHFKQVWVDIYYTYSGQSPELVTSYPPVLYWETIWTPNDPSDDQEVWLTAQNSPVGPGLGMGYFNQYANGAGRLTAYYEIFPQPDYEGFGLLWANRSVVITQAIMLTQCNPIPEPVFFQMGALLGLSGIGLLKLRRR